MKKNALVFISALFMSAAVFVSCSDGSSSGSSSSLASDSSFIGEDGVEYVDISSGAKAVTATAQDGGIHFSIKIPAHLEKLGVGHIGIDNMTEDTGIVHPEANVNMDYLSDLVYPLVEPEKTYTFCIRMEPAYERTLPDWKKDCYSEKVTVKATGGIGEIKASSVPKAEITKYEEFDFGRHTSDCNLNVTGGDCTCTPYAVHEIEICFRDSAKANFSYPAGVTELKDGAAVCVGDAKDNWELYTNWVGGYSWFEPDPVEGGNTGSVSFENGYDDYKLFNKCREIAKKYNNDSIMIQRRWELAIPKAKGLDFIILSLGEPADVEKIRVKNEDD